MNEPGQLASEYLPAVLPEPQSNEPERQSMGWFKACRSTDALELIRTNPLAYVLASVIAWRCRWRDGFNQYGLGQGEALIGDHRNYGMSAREYRTAKQQLAKWNFATFQATSKGTIARLLDTRLFDTLPNTGDKRNDRQATNGRQAGDKQATTNKTDKKEKTEKEGRESSPPVLRSLSPTEQILRSDELKRVEQRLQDIKDGASHVAGGSIYYSELERDERTKLRARQAELKSMLGLMV